MILRRSFPLIFAFVCTLLYVMLVTSYPVLAMQISLIAVFPVVFSRVSVPFVIMGNANPVIMLTGILLIALLCGVIQ